MTRHNRLKRIVLLAMYSVILIVTDYMLAFIPNVQLSMFLVVLLASIFKAREAAVVVLVYVLVDNLLYGGIGIYTIPMVVSWLGIILAVNIAKPTVFSTRKLALLSIAMSVWYALPFMVTSILLYNIDPIAYIIADIPFWIVMALSSYVSIDLLYEPLYKVVKVYEDRSYEDIFKNW